MMETPSDALVGGVVVVTPTADTPPPARHSRRRRRPSGAAPPLPRSLGLTGKGWLVAVAALTAWLVVALASSGARRLADKVDSAILRAFAEVRTPWLTSLLRPVDRVTAGWGLSVVAFGLLGLLIVFRRWRHLFTFLGAVLILGIIGQILVHAFARHRPYDVAIIGRWVGYSMPAAAVAITTIVGVGVVYGLVVPGRPRTAAKTIAIAFLGLVVLTRLYLGADHPSDVLVSGVFAVAIAVNAFRFFTPNEVFPVAYRRGKTAHLDIGGRRGEAVKRAVEDQLGL
ncbi:MAG: hypothetical protein QOJ19_2041, partial [Acidimicrobiia bacterium]|nr:hypothetical protein [Acidimicrobiia bacterium]